MRLRRPTASYEGQAPVALLTADPPWPFSDHLPGDGRGAGKNYSLLSHEQIQHFPLPPLADDCALLLWRVGSMVEEAYAVVRAWGFVPKSELIWNKYRKCGECAGLGHRERKRAERVVGAVRHTIPAEAALAIDRIACETCYGTGRKRHFGMGRTVRNCHEVAIVATHGRPVRLDGGVRSAFDALVSTDAQGKVIHSAKPPEFFAIAEKLYGGPRVELFARSRRVGWDCYGNELGDSPATISSRSVP